MPPQNAFELEWTIIRNYERNDFCHSWCVRVCESLCAVAVSTMNASCVSHVCGQSVRPYVNWPTSMDKVHSNTKLNPFWCLPACLFAVRHRHRAHISHNKENHSSARLYSIDFIRLVFGSHINTPIYHRLLAALLFVVSTSLCPFMQNKYYKKAGEKKNRPAQTGLAHPNTRARWYTHIEFHHIFECSESRNCRWPTILLIREKCRTPQQWPYSVPMPVGFWYRPQNASMF